MARGAPTTVVHLGLFVMVGSCASATFKDMPQWMGPLPQPTLPRAGLKQLPRLQPRVTVFNITTSTGGNSSVGLYNHGPMVVWVPDMSTFLCAWYNAPLSESHGMRVIMAASPDAVTWTAPVELFPSTSSHGEENEPFVTVNGRLYASASDAPTYNNTHDSGQRGALLMRRVLGPSNFGPIFWVAAVPPPGQLLKFPLWTDMDGQTIGDVRDILSTFVNETVRMPPKTQTDMTKGSLFNERSLYSLPTDDAALVLLLRGGRGSPHLWAARCKLDGPAGTGPAPDADFFSCKSGTGAYEYEQPSLVFDMKNGSGPPPSVRQCNWSVPVATNIPDAPSRTCAGHLPRGGGIGVLGNQGGPGGPNGPRDPLTFIVATDGIHYDKQWAVEAGSPKPKWPTLGHPQGWQYPNFMWCKSCGSVRDVIIFSYSVSKEDIVITLASLNDVL